MTIGRLKLQAETPSTAFFGNGDVLKAARRLAERHGLQVSGRPFCGKGCRGSGNICLESGDSAEAKDAQWRQLTTEFARADTALVCHMWNHYCMFYACREWAERGEDGSVTVVRQVLSAKPGQRPTRWFDWADLRKMMLGWVGYKILAFKIEKAA